MNTTIRTLILACCLPAYGCSFARISPPPESAEKGIKCEPIVTPALDTIGAGILGGVAATGHKKGEYTDAETAALGTTGVAILVSAVYGFVSISQCETAEEKKVAKLQEESWHTETQ